MGSDSAGDDARERGRGGERDRKIRRDDPVGEIRSEVRDAIGQVRSAFQQVRDATSQIGGIGALIGDVVRRVSDVDTIKALADPTRLAILRALMDDQGQGYRVMSAKELAEELGENQTKLYRHLKVLVDANLIEVAETRLVSGIVETRYRAAQTELHFDTEGMNGAGADEQMISMIGVGMDEYRDRFLANARSGGFPFAPTDTPRERQVGGVSTSGGRFAPERARELHLKLNAILTEIEQEPRVADGVPVEVMLAWYSPVRKGEGGG